MRISDWSSDVCSSDLAGGRASGYRARARPGSVARLRAGHRLAASAEYRTTLPHLIQPELPPARQARRGPMLVSGEEFPMRKYAYQAAPWMAIATCLAATAAHADEADPTINVTPPQITRPDQEPAANTAAGRLAAPQRDDDTNSNIPCRN